MAIATNFETHLTVAITTDTCLATLRDWAATHQFKFTHILLQSGQSASQPMITMHTHGTLESEQARALSVKEELERAGMTVSRVKMEVEADDLSLAPQTDVQAAANRADQYFEHHVKLLLPSKSDIAELIALAQSHDAHVSRNAAKWQGDGHQSRFVTQRAYRTGRQTAKMQLAELIATLNKYSLNVIEVEEEFVVSDSNLALDRGWI